jgi:multicomponent Na+:H+ antiporter subunit B
MDFFLVDVKLNYLVNYIIFASTALVMVFTCYRLIIAKNLLESVLIMSVFSVLITICYLFMDAPDVAMTEAALGACLSSCVMINILKICGEDTGRTSVLRTSLSAILCIAFIVILSYASLGLPEYGNPDNAIHLGASKYYIENTTYDIEIPSMVAAILASYRAFDTLGEASVILIAGLAVLVICSRKKSEHSPEKMK